MKVTQTLRPFILLYVTKFISELLRGLRELRERLRQESIAQQAPVDANRRVFESQQELHETATRVSETLYELTHEESLVPSHATLHEAIEAVAAQLPFAAEPSKRMQDDAGEVVASGEMPRS